MNTHKKYLNVIASFTREGVITPRIIKWDDGTRHKIDRVVSYMPGRRSKRDISDRYTILVGGRLSELYYERNPDSNSPAIGRWFIELDCPDFDTVA